MAQYLLLVHDDEALSGAAGPEALERYDRAHQAFNAEHAAVVRGGEALEPSGTATSIRPDAAGGFVVTDGPFAETKEALAGYIVIEAADLDQAIAIAKQVPMTFGGVEVRPVLELDW